MRRHSFNRVGMVVPVVCSIVAFGIVVGNVIAGVPPQADENASAHIFQLLIVAQFPFVILFIATATWESAIRPLAVLAVQAAALAMAFLSLWLSGY